MQSFNPTDILNGKTYSYIEVFGVKDGIRLGTELNDVRYYIYDRYCMNPSCICNDVMLHFVEKSEHESETEASFAVSLSLINKKFEILDSRGISKKQIEGIVKHSLKNSNEAIDLFKKRYKEMKSVGKNALQGNKKNKNETAQSKPERNSPCPCGSGKKYKRCCGA